MAMMNNQDRCSFDVDQTICNRNAEEGKKFCSNHFFLVKIQKQLENRINGNEGLSKRLQPRESLALASFFMILAQERRSGVTSQIIEQLRKSNRCVDELFQQYQSIADDLDCERKFLLFEDEIELSNNNNGGNVEGRTLKQTERQLFDK